MIDYEDHDLGYAGTLGWSGSSTSRERAEDEAESGVASARLSLALDLVSKAGPYGLTVKELRGLTEWHHGQASGALSNLHKVGWLARLHDQRGHCKIYVTHENVQGRLTERQGRPRATRLDLSASDRAVLVDARDRARALYGRASGSTTVWADLSTYTEFWRIITKIVDQG